MTNEEKFGIVVGQNEARMHRLCKFGKKMAKQILLNRGKFTIVDDEDYVWLSRYRWYALKRRDSFYAVRNIATEKGQTLILMHRQILNVPKGKQIDHINHDGLDNRKANMRICTNSENGQNKFSKTHSSKYKGVSWNKKESLYRCQIQRNRKAIHIGRFRDETEAALAYDQRAKELYGESALTNFSHLASIKAEIRQTAM